MASDDTRLILGELKEHKRATEKRLENIEREQKSQGKKLDSVLELKRPKNLKVYGWTAFLIALAEAIKAIHSS